MASFISQRKESSVSIPFVERDNNNVTLYVANVAVGNFHWQVKHRYSSFAALHEVLVSDHGVAKDLLPPKKVIGNQDPTFIEKRRIALEAYLKTVLNFLQRAMPVELAHFLHFQHYDIHFLLQRMALQFFYEGDTLLQQPVKTYKFTPLQLHAISERLKQPCPPMDIPDKRLDFSHVLDFCCQLTKIEIEGSNFPLNSSNIVPNQLPFDLTAFKSLRHLAMMDVIVTNLSNVQSLRQNLVSWTIHHSQLRSIGTLVMCDVLHRDFQNAGAEFTWTSMKELDVSFNYLEEIDDSLRLMPNVTTLNLSHNKLTAVQGLTHLPHLSHLSLAANSFYTIENLHVKLGNIVHLDMTENRITSLSGFSRLYSLENLELACNAVSDLNEVHHLSHLPCLEALTLTGNPVASVVDYRTRVLERIGIRAPELCLDNERPTQKELDTVAVLQALRIVQEGRTPPQYSS